MPSEDRFLNILRQYWGFDDFRGIQRDIIQSISQGKDTLGLMPTGGGKSITFQVPALAMDGVCLVITPLIALMKDQVARLRSLGIIANAIYSGQTRHEINTILDNCIFGEVKLLYVSPERLNTEIFRNKIKKMHISFITVDEAHCISQWGYDFRPSYLHIADIKKLVPEVPILALTATATPEVADDIQEKLSFQTKNVFSMSFERKNLSYVVRHASDKEGQLIHILQSVSGSSIVYVRSRKRSAEISNLLNDNGIKAAFFHAGLEQMTKDERQNAWKKGDIRVIVATNAFGMGIDKPDVRTVIHFDCPDSIEAYFQEAGRAGRDKKQAYAVLLHNNSDNIKLKKRIPESFPDKQFILDIYEHLAFFFEVGIGSGYGHTFKFDINRFCRTYKYFPVQTDSALKILDKAEYIRYETDPNDSARLMFLLGRNELYKLNHLTPHEDKLITVLLRNYGSLFTDYVFIDYDLICKQSGLTSQQVYLLLRGMTQRHILNFIPRNNTPTITYLQRRVETKEVFIPKDVYELRRERYARRIEKMIEYANNDNVCRSRQLLNYFGETKNRNCHQCDVCLETNTRAFSSDEMKKATTSVLDLLSDKKQHHITELNEIIVPQHLLDTAIEELMKEEIVFMNGSCIYRK